MLRSPRVLLSLLALSYASSARAEEPPPVDDDSAEVDAESSITPKLSLMASPVLFVKPIFRLTAEHALPGERGGVALVGALGSVNVTNPSGDKSRHTFYEVGAQARWYVLGTFRSGPVVALHGRYTHFGSDELLDNVISSAAEGVGVAPVVGFKAIAHDYLTFEFLGGAEFMVHRPTYTPASVDKAGPVLLYFHINAGWSLWYLSRARRATGERPRGRDERPRSPAQHQVSKPCRSSASSPVSSRC